MKKMLNVDENVVDESLVVAWRTKNGVYYYYYLTVVDSRRHGDEVDLFHDLCGLHHFFSDLNFCFFHHLSAMMMRNDGDFHLICENVFVVTTRENIEDGDDQSYNFLQQRQKAFDDFFLKRNDDNFLTDSR